MSVVYTSEALAQCLAAAFQLSPDAPVVISQFISEAKELEIDGVVTLFGQQVWGRTLSCSNSTI
jgi:carbamoylphosphate synthase large subunit